MIREQHQFWDGEQHRTGSTVLVVQDFYSSVHGLLRPANGESSAHQVSAPLKQKGFLEALGGSIQ